MVLGLQPNHYEVVQWPESEYVGSVFRQVQGMRCVRYMSLGTHKGEDHFMVDINGGRNSFRFTRGDTLVFTEKYVFWFPAEKAADGAEAQAYSLGEVPGTLGVF